MLSKRRSGRSWTSWPFFFSFKEKSKKTTQLLLVAVAVDIQRVFSCCFGWSHVLEMHCSLCEVLEPCCAQLMNISFEGLRCEWCFGAWQNTHTHTCTDKHTHTHTEIHPTSDWIIVNRLSASRPSWLCKSFILKAVMCHLVGGLFLLLKAGQSRGHGPT